MKIVPKIPYIVIAGLASVLIYASCANQGIPGGGPKDTIPPELVRTEPGFGELNYKGDEIRLTFNEYVVMDKVAELLVVSPPLEKRPSVRMRSKTLLLQFNEELRDSVTYSIDFKNSIEDNNERNPYKSLRFLFSTGDVYDSLRVAGMVKDAGNLEPLNKALVMLYRNLNDTAVYKLRPDYIARTDEKGIFFFDNIAPGRYHIFSVDDANSDLKYDEGAEEIAFIDTLIVPDAQFIEEPDTLVSGADSLLVSGHTQFSPEPVYLLRFMEDVFSQFLTSADRETKYRCRFIFEESVKDTFSIKLIEPERKDWCLLEPNPAMDSITLWLTDTIVANLDTLKVELSYNQLDSVGALFLLKDTLSLVYKEKKSEPVRRRRRDTDEEEVVEIEQFSIGDNLKTTGFDLNSSVYLSMPEPVRYFHHDQVHLYLASDTTGTPLNFSFEKDSAAWRRYKLSYIWEPNTDYRLEVDSAACENIYGITNRKLVKKFKTQKDDYYGAILLETKNVDGPVIIQLLKEGENEEQISSKTVNKDGLVVFDYIPPGKYVLKAIYDTNRNGKWDTGSFKNHTQPEKVAYLQKLIKVRSNWEQKEPWNLAPDPTFPKDIFDPDTEEENR